MKRQAITKNIKRGYVTLLILILVSLCTDRANATLCNYVIPHGKKIVDSITITGTLLQPPNEIYVCKAAQSTAQRVQIDPEATTISIPIQIVKGNEPPVQGDNTIVAIFQPQMQMVFQAKKNYTVIIYDDEIVEKPTIDGTTLVLSPKVQ